MKLGYTIDDDGVHLECEICGADVNLGFDATPSEALKQEINHYQGHIKPDENPPKTQ